MMFRKLRALQKDESGQAMTEYAIMTSYLLLAGIASYPFVMKFAPEMINALQIYVDGFYFVYSLPLP